MLDANNSLPNSTPMHTPQPIGTQTQESTSIKPRSRLLWFVPFAVAPACVLAYFVPTFWHMLRPDISVPKEPGTLTNMILYGVAWLACLILIPLAIAYWRRRRDGGLAIIDETLTMALVGFLMSTGLAIVHAR